MDSSCERYEATVVLPQPAGPLITSIVLKPWVPTAVEVAVSQPCLTSSAATPSRRGLAILVNNMLVLELGL